MVRKHIKSMVKKSQNNLSNIIKRQTNHPLLMPLKRLHQLPLLHIPKFNRGIRTTRYQIGRVTGKLAIPNPPKMSLQHLVLKQFEPVVVGDYFVQFDLFVGGTAG